MLVGRDWGFHEHLAKRPFVGPAGTLLNRALRAAGIDREQCIVTNVVSEKPPGDDWAKHAPGAVEAGVRALHALCRREEPHLLVALGEQAFHALVYGDPDKKEFRITEIRGYVFPSPFGPVLATIHPAFALRAWFPWAPLLNLDLKKARRVFDEASHGGWKGGVSATRARYHETILLHPPASAAPWTAPDSVLALDTEHDGETISCLGWAADESSGYAAPWREDFFPFFRALLESDVPKVLQNGASDEYVLSKHGFQLRRYEHELMLEWHALEPLLAGKVTLDTEDHGMGRSHKSLLFFGSVLTDEPFWKNYEFAEEHERYVLCAKDSRITRECHTKLQALLRQGMA